MARDGRAAHGGTGPRRELDALPDFAAYENALLQREVDHLRSVLAELEQVQTDAGSGPERDEHLSHCLEEVEETRLVLNRILGAFDASARLEAGRRADHRSRSCSGGER